MKLKVTTNGECCVMCRHFTQEFFFKSNKMYYSSELYKLACNQTTEGVRLGFRLR